MYMIIYLIIDLFIYLLLYSFINIFAAARSGPQRLTATLCGPQAARQQRMVCRLEPAAVLFVYLLRLAAAR